MFRGIVKVAIVALGLMSAAPLAAQQQGPRPTREGREWVQQQQPRAARAGVRRHHRSQFRREHPRLARQHRLAMRRLEFRREQRLGMAPRMRAPRGR